MTSFRLKIDPKRRAVARFVMTVRDELQRALAEEAARTGLTKSEVANRLGIHRSAISRRIKGTDNLSLTSVAEMMWAMDRDPIFGSKPKYQKAGSNEQVARLSDEVRPEYRKLGNASSASGNIDRAASRKMSYTAA
jgi:transcriptional regulator with XRE-family HTH domain